MVFKLLTTASIYLVATSWIWTWFKPLSEHYRWHKVALDVNSFLKEGPAAAATAAKALQWCPICATP